MRSAYRTEFEERRQVLGARRLEVVVEVRVVEHDVAGRVARAQADDQDDHQRREEEQPEPDDAGQQEDRRGQARAEGRANGDRRRGLARRGGYDVSVVHRLVYLSRSAPSSCTSSTSLSSIVLARVDVGIAQDRRVDELLRRRVRPHVADVVRVVRAHLGVEVEVDPQVGRDRVRRARQHDHRVGAADGALARDDVLRLRACRRASGSSRRTTRGSSTASPTVRSPMSSCVYLRSSGFCCSSRASDWSSWASSRVFGSKPRRNAATANTSW